MLFRLFKRNARSPPVIDALALNTDRKYTSHPHRIHNAAQSSSAGGVRWRSHSLDARRQRQEAASKVAARIAGKRIPAGETPPSGRKRTRQSRGSRRLYRIEVAERSAVPGK